MKVTTAYEHVKSLKGKKVEGGRVHQRETARSRTKVSRGERVSEFMVPQPRGLRDVG